MAEIPVSTIVRVTIATAPTFPSRMGFGTLNIVGPSTVIPIQERARIYADITGVASDFPTSSEEYKAAETYFSQNPRPAQVVISRRAVADLPPEVRGGGNPETTIATWAAITDGALTVTIGGDSEDVNNIDFNAVVNMDDVAAAIQARIRAVGAANGTDWTLATCTFEGGRFFIRGGDAGAGNTIGFPTASAGGTSILDLMEIGGSDATKQDGIAAEDLPTALNAIQDVNQDWYGLALTSELRDDITVNEDVAEWVEARIKVFGVDSEDKDILDAVNTNDIAATLQARNFRRSMVCYNWGRGEYLAVSALARAFVVNFNNVNTTLTLKFKQMPTITTAELTVTQKSALDGKNANAFIDVGGNPMFAEGTMANGTFFDEVHGLDWLQNAIETNVFGKLYTDTTKTAMTNPGVASLQQQVEAALDQGRVNGLLAPGYTNDGRFLDKGYETSAIRVEDHNQSDREARKGPPISFYCIGAGAIHGIEINGTFQR